MTLTLQGGAASVEGSLDRKLGVIAIRVKCYAGDLTTAITGTLPEIGILLPESQPRNFSSRAEGGGYDVICNLEGHLTPEDASGEEYSLDATTSEDPIESHPEFLLLKQLYDGKTGADGKATFNETLGDESGGTFEFDIPGFDDFATAGQGEELSKNEHRNPMHGVESYLVPGLTWTRKWVSPTLPGTIVRSLGTIEQPPGNPPELSGNRNWLKIRARATFRGNIWQIEESWLLSGPLGWVPEMYRYR